MPKVTDQPKKGKTTTYANQSSKPYAKKDSSKIELTTLNSWYTYAAEAARKKHWEFFVMDQFIEGNHDIRGNPNDNSIEVAKKSDRIPYPINKMYSSFRAIRAFVTRNKPIIEVDPEELDIPDAIEYARKANRLLARDNKLNNSRRLNKEWVYYGLKYGIGWRQIGYDPVNKVTIRWSVSPYDVLVGSKIGEPEDAPYIIKTFSRTMDYWRNKYPDADFVVPDNEGVADEYQKLSLQINYDNTGSSSQPFDQQTALGMEAWYRVYERNKYGGYINKCIFTKNGIVSIEETPYSEYPFIPYKAEISPNQSLPSSPLKQAIAPQRMLDLLNMQMLEYNHLVNRGRFQVPKNAGFKVIYAKEGQIIQHNTGSSVSVVPPPAINPALSRQIEDSVAYMEDLTGQHDASQGATPQRVSSGAAIEALQQGDSNNISDFRDNFEDALALEASWILKMYSLFESEGILLTDEDGKNTEEFGIVGSEALKQTGKSMPKYPAGSPKKDQEAYFSEDNGGYYDVVKILPENQVKVSVTSELGETKEARRELLMRLVELGLPLKVLLEHLEFPNTTDIFERIASEAAADMAMEAMKGQMGQSPLPPEGAPTEGLPPPPPEDIEAELAAISESI